MKERNKSKVIKIIKSLFMLLGILCIVEAIGLINILDFDNILDLIISIYHWMGY